MRECDDFSDDKEDAVDDDNYQISAAQVYQDRGGRTVLVPVIELNLTNKRGNRVVDVPCG